MKNIFSSVLSYHYNREEGGTLRPSNWLTFSLLSVSLFTPFPAIGSGIFLQEAVIANAGTTGAGDGVYTQSAAAMWANPATMPWMGETLTTVNVTAFDLQMNYHDQSGADDGQAASLMPSAGLFHVRQLNEDVHFGIALGTVGGSSLDYGSEWQGAALMTDIALAAVQINPALGFKVTDQLSWGSVHKSVGLLWKWAWRMCDGLSSLLIGHMALMLA